MNDIFVDEQFVRDRITTLRLAKGVSEREMSLSLGMCESYIRNITSASALPSMASFLNICEYLGITPAEFFDLNLKSPNLSRETLVELERLFGSQLPLFTKWLRSLEKFHAEALVDMLQLHETSGK